MFNEKIVWSLKEASTKTGLPYGFIRQLCLDGKVKHIRSGVKFYVNKDSLIEYCGGMTDGLSKLETKTIDFCVNK